MKETHDTPQEHPQELACGARLLLGQYEVLSCLAQGGFGITYLARDSLERQVVLKECFPGALCTREGPAVLPINSSGSKTYRAIVQNFVAEARRLANLEHPNIVRVHQVFEENHTAYMSMDFVAGEELLDVLEDTPERVTPELVECILRSALTALEYIHGRGVLHRDISPDNMILDSEDHLTLIDFGSALDVAHQQARASATMLAVKEGYSPHEFYVENAPQGEASDLYSLAATFYHLITGSAPIDGYMRFTAIENGDDDPVTPLSEGNWPYDAQFLALMDRALSVDLEERIGSAREWLNELGEPEAEEDIEENALAPFGNMHARQIMQSSCEILPPEMLDKVITDIVNAQDTSEDATAPEPVRQKPKVQAQTSVATKAQNTPPKVDILGNPIHDVDAWMKEQESRRRFGLSNRKKTAAPKPEQKPERKSLVSRLLSTGLRLS